jgi:sn-glycerol 3-phosphate transport system permease protein
VAPAIAGILWAFLFAPSIGIVDLRAEAVRHRLELDHQRRPGDAADRGRGHVEADQLQLPLLPGGLQSIPRSLLEAAAIDGATPLRRFWTIVFPLLSP